MADEKAPRLIRHRGKSVFRPLMPAWINSLEITCWWFDEAASFLQEKKVIKPTVGRVVWFYPDPTSALVLDKDQPLAATVACVITDEVVHLTVHGHDGTTHPRKNVKLVQEGDVPMGCCGWMPYQKGQAAKTDTIEPRVAELESSVSTIEQAGALASTPMLDGGIPQA